MPASLAASALDDFAAVVDEHRGRVFRVLLAILRDHDAAETLAQDCFVRAHQGRAGYRGDSSVATWLVAIAVNLARDHIRNRKLAFWRLLVHKSEGLGQVAEHVADGHRSPEQHVIAQDQAEKIWGLASRLSNKQQAIFTLRFLEQMEIGEIAIAMRMNQATVKVHLHRAVANLRKMAAEKRL